MEFLTDAYYWYLVGFALLMLGIRIVNFWLFAKKRQVALTRGDKIPSQNIFIHMVSMMLMAALVLYVMNPSSEVAQGVRTIGVAILAVILVGIYAGAYLYLKNKYGVRE